MHDEATILEAPEGNPFLTIVAVLGTDANAGSLLAWIAFGHDAKWHVKSATDLPNRGERSRYGQVANKHHPTTNTALW